MAKPPPCNSGCGPHPPPPDGQCPGGVSGNCPGNPFPGIGQCLVPAGYGSHGVGMNGKPACCKRFTLATCCK